MNKALLEVALEWTRANTFQSRNPEAGEETIKALLELQAIRENKPLNDVIRERTRQDLKWGEQNHAPYKYLAILGEEFGETCRAAQDVEMCKNDTALPALLYHLRLEAVQTAAVALAIVECLDREKWHW